MDMKIALDEARPMHVEIMEGRNVHLWIIAALLARDGWAKQGQVMFECTENKFSFARCLGQKSVETPRLWQKWLCNSWHIWKKSG